MNWTWRITAGAACFLAVTALSLGKMPVERAGASAPLVPLVASGETVSAPGYVEPISEERVIAAATVGRLAQMNVQEGDSVHVGQILAELDNGDLVASLEAARAEVRMRESELLKLRNGARPQEIDVQTAAVQDAAAAANVAHLDLERRNPLMQSGAVSKEALDHARAVALSAEARYRMASERLALLTAPPREEDLAIAEAQVSAAKARAEAIAAEVEKTRIRSPIDGIVLKRERLQGEAVTNNPPTVIFRLGDVSHLRVRAQVDEVDVGRLAVGRRAVVRSDAFPGKEFVGRVVRIGQRMAVKTLHAEDPRDRLDTRTLDVFVELDPDVRLPTGMRVDVYLETPAEVHS